MSSRRYSSTVLHAVVVALLLVVYGGLRLLPKIGILGIAEVIEAQNLLQRLVGHDIPILAVFPLLLGSSFWLAALLFLAWVYRAHRNVGALLDEEGPWAPSLSVLAFLIPIANAYLGYRAIEVLWLTSAPAARNQSWRKAPTPTWLPVWWATVLVWLSVPFVAGLGYFAHQWDVSAANDFGGIISDIALIPILSGVAYLVVAIAVRQARMASAARATP